jgi:hypothetical protein
MLGVVALNRFRLMPGFEPSIAAANHRSALGALRQSLAVETACTVATLALVAWLGTLGPPASGCKGAGDGESPPAPTSSGHLLAALCAFPARSGTILHTVELFAARHARPANLGTLATDMLMVLGPARHEVERDAANLRTIHHQLEVLRLGVLAAHFEAVGHRHRQAGNMAFVAVGHTGLHLGAHLVVHRISPCEPRPFLDTRSLTKTLAGRTGLLRTLLLA